MRSHLRATWLLAWPIILNQLGHMAMGLIDSLMVGRLGATALAGLAFSLSLFHFFLVLFMGLGAAISVFVAHSRALGRNQEAVEYYRHGLLIHFVLSILLAFLCTHFLVPELSLFGQSPETQEAARPYLVILMWSLVPAAVFIAARQFTEGLGHPHLAMWLMYAGLLLNTLFNWLLIFGNAGFPALGLAGAAWGTLIVRILMAVAILILPFYLPLFQEFRIERFTKALDFSKIFEILRIGIPSSAQYLFEMAAFAGAAIMVGWIGSQELAAHHIAINLASFTFMFALGTSTAALIRVSAARGQYQIVEARRAGFSAVILVNLVMGFCGLLFIFLNDQLPRLYIQDVDVIALAAPLLVIAGLFQLFDGTQGVLIGALRGMKDVAFPTFTTFTAYWVVAIPAGYFFGIHKDGGIQAIWWALALGLALSSLTLALRFWWVTRSKSLNPFPEFR